MILMIRVARSTDWGTKNYSCGVSDPIPPKRCSIFYLEEGHKRIFLDLDLSFETTLTPPAPAAPLTRRASATTQFQKLLMIRALFSVYLSGMCCFLADISKKVSACRRGAAVLTVKCLPWKGLDDCFCCVALAEAV